MQFGTSRHQTHRVVEPIAPCCTKTKAENQSAGENCQEENGSGDLHCNIDFKERSSGRSQPTANASGPTNSWEKIAAFSGQELTDIARNSAHDQAIVPFENCLRVHVQ